MADPDDRLYGLPLEEFTPARDAAARELRRAGDRDAAARVAKLPKPSPAAWTANQVAREQPELIEALLEAGAALREAQDAAVSGHGGRSLREATLAERGAVDAVMTAATAHHPAGRALSRAMADRLRTTLHAAAGDVAIREALANGRLAVGGLARATLRLARRLGGGPLRRALRRGAASRAATSRGALALARRLSPRLERERPRAAGLRLAHEAAVRERLADRLVARRGVQRRAQAVGHRPRQRAAGRVVGGRGDDPVSYTHLTLPTN